jgi:hypothetical protein
MKPDQALSPDGNEDRDGNPHPAPPLPSRRIRNSQTSASAPDISGGNKCRSTPRRQTSGHQIAYRGSAKLDNKLHSPAIP